MGRRPRASKPSLIRQTNQSSGEIDCVRLLTIEIETLKVVSFVSQAVDITAADQGTPGPSPLPCWNLDKAGGGGTPGRHAEAAA